MSALENSRTRRGMKRMMQRRVLISANCCGAKWRKLLTGAGPMPPIPLGRRAVKVLHLDLAPVRDRVGRLPVRHPWAAR
jgi:hypothetical protein